MRDKDETEGCAEAHADIARERVGDTSRDLDVSDDGDLQRHDCENSDDEQAGPKVSVREYPQQHARDDHEGSEHEKRHGQTFA
jgi:hypothetical protein